MTPVRSRTAGFACGLAAIVGVLVVSSKFGGVGATEASGLVGPGAFVEFGLPTIRLLGELLAAATVGALLGVILTSGATFALHGCRRVALICAASWSAMSAFQIVFSYSNFAAVGLLQALSPSELVDFIGSAPQARALAVQSVGAVVVAFGCARLGSPAAAKIVLVMALATAMPPALTGHSASGGNQLLAVGTLCLHVCGASIWLGGVALLASLALRPRDAYDLPRVAQRFSRLALGCFIVVALSGVVNATLRLDAFSELFSSHYGNLVLAKAAGLLVIGAIGAAHRRRTLISLQRQDARPFRRLIVAESFVMATTFAIAVALSSSAPPGV